MDQTFWSVLKRIKRLYITFSNLIASENLIENGESKTLIKLKLENSNIKEP